MPRAKETRTATGSSSSHLHPTKGQIVRAPSQARPLTSRGTSKTTFNTTRNRRRRRRVKERCAKQATRNSSRAKLSSVTLPSFGELIPALPVRRCRNEPPPGARPTRSGLGQWPHQVAPQQRHDRDHFHPHLHHRSLPGLYQTRPLHRLWLRAQGDLLEL